MSTNAWLSIARTPALSGRRLIELLPAFGSVEALCAAPGQELRRAGLDAQQVEALKQPDPALRASDRAWLEAPEHHLIGVSDEDYPALLRQIADPPAVLWVVGDLGALWQPQVAMVGSRNPTAGGTDHARDFARSFARDGWTVTSGLAAGIDVTAHLGALEGGGQTVAVLGTGADRIYPARNEAAARAIAGQGALVSEFPLGTPARKGNFPARNRLISGLSLGVLVVEAALNSGSLITARLAAEQGREVFALPGSLHNPMAKGCHRLIKQGARLAESTADVTDALAPLAGELALALTRRLEAPAAVVPGKRAAGDGDGAGARSAGPDSDRGRSSASATDNAELLEDDDYRRLLDAIGHDPVTYDRLVERTGLKVREVSSMLLMLELRGLIQSLDGGRVVLSAERPAETGALELSGDGPTSAS